MAEDPISLVTLAEARQRCRILITAEDDDLQLMIEQASGAVIERVDRPDVTELWDEDTVPASVQGAVLEQVLWIFERDTGINKQLNDRGALAPRCESLLMRWIKPACA